MKKILVVDDEKELREALVTLLEYEGYEAIQSDNGISAIEIARSAHPDLIISDINMPNMNGVIFSEIVKEDPDIASIPVILMSGVAQMEEAWKTEPKQEYIAKPFTGIDIISVIQRNLNSAVN